MTTQPHAGASRLQDTILQLHSARSPQSLLNVLRIESARLFDADSVYLYRIDPEWDDLVWTPPNDGDPVRFPVGHGVAGWVAAENEPWRSGNANTEPSFVAKLDLPDGKGAHALLSVPLTDAHDDVIGVLQIASGRPDAFDRRDEETATNLAAHAGVALGRVQELDGYRTFTRTLAASIARAVDGRHLITIGHSERVARLALALGRAAGCSDEQLEWMELGALLHAIGRLELQTDGVSPEHLHGAGGALDRFTDAILRGVSFPPHLEPVYNAGLATHLRLHGEDPTGRKLARDQMVEDILLVANAFDEIQLGVFDRDYKRRSDEQAVQRLQELAGKRLDAKLVELFVRHKCWDIERRRWPRVELHTPVDVTIIRADGGDGPRLETDALDISEGGLMYRAANPPPLMSMVRLLLHLPTEKLEAFGRVARVLPGLDGDPGVRVGVYFIWFDTLR
jgi:putative methionine-R-sulfoxide reductase with GAF domain